MIRLIAASALVASASATPAPLDGEALSRIFLNGDNTYLAAPRSPDVIVGHPSHELFRPNGTYSRRIGRFGPDGWYAIEGDRLCVSGDGIPNQCRMLIPKGANLYLLVDVVDGSEAVLELSQVK